MSLELPQARDADALEAALDAFEAQAARGEAPNNQMTAVELFMTARISPWII